MAATSVYAASKAGLIAASASLETELQGTGVGVTTVHLGAVDTVMAEDAMTTDVLRPHFDRMDKLGMTKRMDPVEAAAAIVDGVVKEKCDLVVPKNGLPVTGLSNVPRRLGRLLAHGLPIHEVPIPSVSCRSTRLRMWVPTAGA
jgi:short-subunit dehydrogenase